MAANNVLENDAEERYVRSIEAQVAVLGNSRVGVVRGRSFTPDQDGQEAADAIEARLRESGIITEGGQLGVRRAGPAVILDEVGNPYDPRAETIYAGKHITDPNDEFAVQLADVMTAEARAAAVEAPVVEAGRRVEGVVLANEPAPKAKADAK